MAMYAENLEGDLTPQTKPNVSQFGWTNAEYESFNQLTQFVDAARQFSENAKTSLEETKGIVEGSFKNDVDSVKTIYADFVPKYNHLVDLLQSTDVGKFTNDLDFFYNVIDKLINGTQDGTLTKPDGTTITITPVSGFMTKNNNLSDLADIITARNNLDVFSKLEVATSLGIVRNSFVPKVLLSTTSDTISVGRIPTFGSSTGLEIGEYIDMHDSTQLSQDYAVRFRAHNSDATNSVLDINGGNSTFNVNVNGILGVTSGRLNVSGTRYTAVQLSNSYTDATKRNKFIEIGDNGDLVIITRGDDGANHGMVTIPTDINGAVYTTANPPTAADIGAVQLADVEQTIQGIKIFNKNLINRSQFSSFGTDYTSQASSNSPFWSDGGAIPHDCFAPIVGGNCVTDGFGNDTFVKFGIVTRGIMDPGISSACILVGAHTVDPSSEKHSAFLFSIDGNYSCSRVFVNQEQPAQANSLARKDYVDGKASSDIKLKSDIKPITDALDSVNRLNGYTFTKIEWPLTTIDEYAGVIAQEVEEVLPQAVKEAVGEDDSIKTVDPLALCGLLIEAIKELNEEIKVLKSKL